MARTSFCGIRSTLLASEHLKVHYDALLTWMSTGLGDEDKKLWCTMPWPTLSPEEDARLTAILDGSASDCEPPPSSPVTVHSSMEEDVSVQSPISPPL